jgi:protein phosphatase
VNQLRFSVGGHTDQGGYRSANEDHLLVDLALGLFAVFDGGGSWGDDPSQVGPRSAPIIQRVVREAFSADPQTLIERAFEAATHDLQQPDEQLSYDGGSVALTFLRDGKAHVSWLGDSMVHRVATGRIEALTWTHTYRNVLLRMGKSTEADEAMRGERFSNIMIHCLGGELPKPLEVVSFAPKPSDRLILTTDGVHDVLLGSHFIAVCQAHPEPQACAARLIELAREHGSRDNCTCVVIAFE